MREIFRRAAVLGWTGYQIAAWLNRHGIPAAKGGKWESPVVRRMLYNPCYVGRARFAQGKEHETDIAVEAILTGEQAAWFDTAQVARAKNRETKVGRPAQYFDLQSLLFCGRCGRRLTGRRVTRHYRAYQCRHITFHPYKRLCLAPQVQCDALDKSFWTALITRLRDTETVLAMVLDYQMRQAESLPQLGPSTEKRLAKLKRDEIAARRVLGDGDLISMWDDSKKRLLAIRRREIATLERGLEKAAKVAPMVSRAVVEEFSTALADALTWTDHKDRRGVNSSAP